MSSWIRNHQVYSRCLINISHGQGEVRIWRWGEEVLLTGCLSQKEPGEGNADLKTQSSSGFPGGAEKSWGVPRLGRGLYRSRTWEKGVGCTRSFTLHSRKQTRVGWGLSCRPLNCHTMAPFNFLWGPGRAQLVPSSFLLHSGCFG